jgi:hypothetical protein
MSLKFVHWQPSCAMRTDGRTDIHNKVNSRFSQFCEGVNLLCATQGNVGNGIQMMDHTGSWKTS